MFTFTFLLLTGVGLVFLIVLGVAYLISWVLCDVLYLTSRKWPVCLGIVFFAFALWLEFNT